MSLMGHWSETLRVTPHIQNIADKVKPQLEEKENKKYPVFVAVTFKRYSNSFFIPHTKYLIKVSVSNSTGECVHLMVFQIHRPYIKEPSLTSYQTGKTIDDWSHLNEILEMGSSVALSADSQLMPPVPIHE